VYTAAPSYGNPPAHQPLPSNETRTCLLASVTSARADDRATLTVDFGLTFDGLTTYNDYGSLVLYAPPRFCFNDTLLTYQVLVQGPISIEVCTFTSDALTVICYQTTITKAVN